MSSTRRAAVAPEPARFDENRVILPLCCVADPGYVHVSKCEAIIATEEAHKRRRQAAVGDDAARDPQHVSARYPYGTQTLLKNGDTASTSESVTFPSLFQSYRAE